MIIGKHRKRVRRLTMRWLIQNLDKAGHRVHYVQVGANDGVLDDPVYDAGRTADWAGLLIEPSPYYFQKLQALHAENPQLICLNIGISDNPGTMTLHQLSAEAEGKYDVWAAGCASMDRGRLEEALRDAGPLDDGDIVSNDVPVERLDHVLAKQRFSQIDLLVIDVEGHEQAVLDSFDLGQMKPRMIVLESNSGRESEAQFVGALKSAGYAVHKIAEDLVAFSPAYPMLTPSDALNLIGFGSA